MNTDNGLALEVEVAIRAHARPDYRRHAERCASKRDAAADADPDAADGADDLGPSEWTLIFDTETTVGLGQRLRVGCYQLYRGTRLRQSGLFVDPDALEPAEQSLVAWYASERGLRLLTRAEFVTQVFFPYGWRRSALIVGANLAYDIAQLAIAHGPAKDKTGFMRGGFSFTLSRNPFLPWVQVKRLGARATAFRFTIPGGCSPEARNNARGGSAAPHRGYFVDLLGLGAALFGQPFSLRTLAETLSTEHQKRDAGGHGAPIDGDYLGYLERDVLVSWECLTLRARYETLALTQTPLTRVYSEASIGKGLLKEAGTTPWQKLQIVPDRLLACILETYYGGRTECHIRRHSVPGVYVDFLSQYPTVFVLQQLDRYLFATGIDWQEEDPAALQRFVQRVSCEDLLEPDFWRQLDALCLIAPEGDLLPTRARYRRAVNPKDPSAAYNVSLAFRRGGPAQWWTLADVIASRLATGRCPHVTRVIRFHPRSRQQNLRAITLAGDAHYRIDPNSDDLIKRLVELRTQLKTDVQIAGTAGDRQRAELLDALQLGVKIEANAIAYGAPIELNLTEHRRPVSISVQRSDGSSYRIRRKRAESPGSWFHPLIATLVAGGGRLLLQLAITLVHAEGGQYAFCDTDSLFIVASRTGGLLACPGGRERLPDGRDAIRALSHQQVKSIVERFRPLNPYQGAAGGRPILELEPENFNPKSGEQLEPLCLALAAKRYALYTLEDGQPRLLGKPGQPGKPGKRRRSEHGLGHLLLPRDPNLGKAPAYDAFWEQLIARELDIEHPEPTWFANDAVGQLTLTSLHDERAFAAYNKNKPYLERIRPWNFLAIAHPTRIARAQHGIHCLIGPYHDDPGERAHQEWIDRANPNRGPYHLHHGDPLELDHTSVSVQTIRDYFNDYRRHADAKMLGPDGNRCHPWTRGLLQPHTITATALVPVGKESNPLTDSTDADDGIALEYREPVCPCGCGNPLTSRKQWWSDACRKRVERRRRPGAANAKIRLTDQRPLAPRRHQGR